MRIRISVIFLLILILFLSLARFLYLGSVPGLNGDEALYGIKTFFMMQRPFTFIGFNSYTGPFVSYLRMPFYCLTGVSVFSVRMPMVMLSLLTALYIYMLLKECYGRRTGIIGVLLFLVMPWSFIYSRFADETHISLIFFAIAGLYYLVRDKGMPDKVLAGLFLGMGVFEHLIFIITPLAYFIFFSTKKSSRSRITKGDLILFSIFLLFLLARVFIIFHAHVFDPQGTGIHYSLNGAVGGDLIHKLLYSFPHFMKMLDGGIFYQRTTGDILVRVIPVNSFLFIASFLFLFFRRRNYPEFRSSDRMFIYIFLLLCIINVIFLMELSLRYHLVTLMFSAILMAIFIGTSRMRDSLRWFFVALIIAVNCFYIGCNYIHSFRQNGGRVSYFWAGNYVENSNGFVDSRILYNFLEQRNIKYIWVPEGFSRWQLIFFDLKNKRLDIKAQPSSIERDKIHFITYKGDRLPYEYGLPRSYSVAKEIRDLDNYRIFLLEK